MAEGTPLPAYVLEASEAPSAGGGGPLKPKVWRPPAGVERSVVIEGVELDGEAEAVIVSVGVGEGPVGAAGAARSARTVARDAGGHGAWTRARSAASSRRGLHERSASVGSTSWPGRPTPSTGAAVTLEQWCAGAARSRLPTFGELVPQLRRNLPGSLAGLLSEISKVFVESTDAELRLLTRTASGSRCPGHLSTLSLLALGGCTADVAGGNAG